MRRELHLLACVMLAGCTAADDATDPPPPPAAEPSDVQRIVDTYRSMRAMTEEAAIVNPSLAILCRGATYAEVVEARTFTGPHTHAAIHIFMNDAAADAFGEPGGAYPVGSIIVKEKQPLGYWADGEMRTSVVDAQGVGGMIKRAPGYDPEHGDWEYFYVEESGILERGRMNSCVQCHRRAAETDHVFGGWATPWEPIWGAVEEPATPAAGSGPGAPSR